MYPLASLQDDCKIYSFRNSVLYSAILSALVASFSNYRTGYAVRTVCVGFLVDQVTLRKVSINVFQSSVNYHFIKFSYTSCTNRWIGSECNGGWSSLATHSLPIIKKYILSYKNFGLRESHPGYMGTGSCQVFEGYDLRLKKLLRVVCFLCGVRSEAEERFECRMFSMSITSWDWRNSWASVVFCVKNELRLNK